MRIDSTFYVRNISVTVNVAKEAKNIHYIEILAERADHREHVLKNYPCELGSNAAINVSSNEEDNKIKVCILKDANNLEDYVISFEFFVDGTGYLDYPKLGYGSSKTEIIHIK